MSGKLIPFPPLDHASAGGSGLAGLLGGLGGAITCLCCLSALGLIGLWATFIPLVAFFKYTYDQEVIAHGASPSIYNLPQIVFLLVIGFLSIRYVKRQIST